MKRTFTLTAASIAIASISALSLAQDGQTISAIVPQPEPEPESRIVELAICLDTSGSMDGLIESAKEKLWAIVNDLALAKPTPTLRVALLTYGNDGHNPEDGWVQIATGLTDDLDLVSERLFELTTNGGTEFVGRVMQHAVTQLDWNPSADSLKLMVVAGNESADQDRSVPFRDMSRDAISRGIMVNSIYCGNPADELAPAWKEISTLADGHFAAIDMNGGTITISTPFDDELTTLSAAVNGTYIPIGTAGQTAWANQTIQDNNASSLNSGAAAQRAQTKSSGVYYCSWDLVDVCAQKDFDWKTVKVEDLPEEMQKMTLEQRIAHVAVNREKRSGLQKQINDVNDKRKAFVTAEMKKAGLDDSNSFDHAIRAAVREQAASKGFTYDDPTPKVTEKEDSDDG